MELQGERLIPAPVETTWAALNDPESLKACIAGCESLERTGENAFAAVVAVKVGPVSARFRGSLQMTNVEPPNRYTINFEGQGGVAGFGKGAADVALTAEGAQQTKLAYAAKAQVGGKLAQVGSRLIDAAAGKITDDFFKAFEALLQSRVAPAVEVDAGVPAGSAQPAAPGAPTGAAPRSPTADASALTAQRRPSARPRPAGALEWILAALVLLVLAYFLRR
jgi:carbon monoxide dehydrogenase subunit G